MIDVRPSALTNSPQPVGREAPVSHRKKFTVFIPLTSIELHERSFQLSSKKKKKMSSKSLILAAASYFLLIRTEMISLILVLFLFHQAVVAVIVLSNSVDLAGAHDDADAAAGDWTWDDVLSCVFADGKLKF